MVTFHLVTKKYEAYLINHFSFTELVVVSTRVMFTGIKQDMKNAEAESTTDLVSGSDTSPTGTDL